MLGILFDRKVITDQYKTHAVYLFQKNFKKLYTVDYSSYFILTLF